MKNFKLKALSLLMAVLCFAVCGCAPEKPSKGPENFDPEEPEDEIVLPDYDAKKDELTFLTSAFFSPAISEQSVQDYIDCGFDVMWINGNNVGYGNSPVISQALKIAEEKNLKCVIDATISRDRPLTESMIYNNYGYQNYSSLWAVNAYDEPLVKTGDHGNTAGIDEISQYIPKFRSIYGKSMPFFINMNPFPSTTYIKPNYTTYLKENIEKIVSQNDPSAQRWLSCDAYPLVYERQRSIHYLKEEWLFNLQLLANAKMDYPELDINTNFFILSTPHTIQSPASYDREIGYNELRLQMYSLIAFGYNMVSYFTYATPPSGNGETYSPALVDASGNKTERYYDAQRLNAEVHAFDHVFLQFDYKGVYCVEGSQNHYSGNDSFGLLDMLPKGQLGALSDVTATGDTLIGMGVDEKGNGGYTVVNYYDPYYEVEDEVTLTFTGATHAIVYVEGEKQEVELSNNKLTLKLGYGEGVFVIPY